jgi:DNA-binding transcriptional MerR regulator
MVKMGVRADAGDPGPWTTLDEFARLAGTTARNVRALQSSGALPPPVMRGRKGFYGHEHRARVLAVLRLQERGFSLAAVRTLLAAWETGATLEEVLGLPPRPRSGPREEEDTFDPFDDIVVRRQGAFLSIVPSPLLEGVTVRAAS